MKVFETFLGSEAVLSLSDCLVSDSDPPIDLQLIVYRSHGSKVRYTDLVGSSLRATLVVTTAGSCTYFLPYTYGMCPDSPSQATLAVPLSAERPTLYLRRGNSWL